MKYSTHSNRNAALFIKMEEVHRCARALGWGGPSMASTGDRCRRNYHDPDQAGVATPNSKRYANDLFFFVLASCPQRGLLLTIQLPHEIP